MAEPTETKPANPDEVSVICKQCGDTAIIEAAALDRNPNFYHLYCGNCDAELVIDDYQELYRVRAERANARAKSVNARKEERERLRKDRATNRAIEEAHQHDRQVAKQEQKVHRRWIRARRVREEYASLYIPTFGAQVVELVLVLACLAAFVLSVLAFLTIAFSLFAPILFLIAVVLLIGGMMYRALHTCAATLSYKLDILRDDIRESAGTVCREMQAQKQTEVSSSAPRLGNEPLLNEPVTEQTAQDIMQTRVGG